MNSKGELIGELCYIESWNKPLTLYLDNISGWKRRGERKMEEKWIGMFSF